MTCLGGVLVTYCCLTPLQSYMNAIMQRQQRTDHKNRREERPPLHQFLPFSPVSKRKREKDGKSERKIRALSHKRPLRHGWSWAVEKKEALNGIRDRSSGLDWIEHLNNWQWVIMTKKEIEVTWNSWDLHNVLSGGREGQLKRNV